VFRSRFVKELAIRYVLELHQEGLLAETLSQITGIGYVSLHRYLRGLIKCGDVKSLVADPGEDPPRYRYFVSPEYRRALAEFKKKRNAHGHQSLPRSYLTGAIEGNESMNISFRHREREAVKQLMREVIESDVPEPPAKPAEDHVVMCNALCEIIHLEHAAKVYKLRAQCLVVLVVALGAVLLSR
jgi:hypothetical protein